MKRLTFYLTVVAFFATSPAYCGVLDVIKNIGTATNLWIALGGVIIAYILKVIPNDKIQAVVGGFFYGLGVAVTLGLSKYKWTKPFWQGVIEPYIIDLIRNTVGTAVEKFIAGMTSDNNA
jgi:hypothetical protein